MRRDAFHWTRLFKDLSRLTLSTSSDGTSTVSLGSLFQCLITLIVKTFFLISKSTIFQFKTIVP